MTKAAKKTAAVVARAEHYDTLISPVITEKSTLATEHGKYVFNVALGAGKQDIKSAVEALFGVKVTKVNTHKRLGKVKRFRNTTAKRIDVKKAIVTLEKGQSIDLSAGVKK